tara:strand:+ start:128 stop:1090 length:963 start_codon:yes stop_codon:yes gene_type:complete
MSNKYGTFSDAGYLAVGDPYLDGKDPLAQSSRYRGLNMKASTRKTGKDNRACFDKLKPLYANEKYALTNEERAARREKEKAGKVTDKPFKPTSLTKHACGLGGYGGCIGGKHESVPGGDCDPNDEKLMKGDPRLDEKPRQITTCPGKKGSYGTRGTTLGGPKGHGVAGEYSYKGDEYDAERKANAAREREGKKKMQGSAWAPARAPKKGGYGTRGTTIGGPKGAGVVGEYSYKEEGPELPEPKGSPIEKQWRPSHPPKRGYNATLQRFPKHMADPAELKIAAAREKMEADAELIEKPFVPPFTGCKSQATKSVVKMNLGR